jgi:diguanylate cyclase (GGDEF)-like protein
MIDIDHFKRFNDDFGHEAGDMVMQHVAAILLDSVGDQGEVFRFGGEEFTILLPVTDETAAAGFAERVRHQVAAATLTHRGRMLGHITVSIGVAASPEVLVTNLISCADTGLLEAKGGGRNRVIRASDLGTGYSAGTFAA